MGTHVGGPASGAERVNAGAQWCAVGRARASHAVEQRRQRATQTERQSKGKQGRRRVAKEVGSKRRKHGMAQHAAPMPTLHAPLATSAYIHPTRLSAQ
eukprot:356071-Chlamydomonas_euryale.AAC.5